MDERFGSYGEDVDLCWRAAKAGWRVAEVDDARGTTRGTGDPRSADVLMDVNAFLILAKHPRRAWRTSSFRIASMVRRGAFDRIASGAVKALRHLVRPRAPRSVGRSTWV